jgi:FkbM family methyltransferase
MQLSVALDDGQALDFECADNPVSRRVCEDILKGKTYPYLPFVEDVRVILDVGANCGATTVHLARHYPDADVHAFEPGSAARAFAERNTRGFPNVRVHPIGLFSCDMRTPLYFGDGDLGMASIHRRDVNLGESEVVDIRDARAWTAEQSIGRIDILKVDVEGAEVEVLLSLGHLLPTVKVLDIEYDSRRARRAIAGLVEGTHELYVGSLLLDQGEIIYLRRDLADLPAATEHLRRMLMASMAAKS